MKNKETGEFELLVGNGQIISGFFILALLLAVFFAMGYIVARAKYQQEPGSRQLSRLTRPAIRVVRRRRPQLRPQLHPPRRPPRRPPHSPATPPDLPATGSRKP